MAEEQSLPQISKQTREKLAAQGFTNHLYDPLQLPSHFIPRGAGFNSFTYLIMGLSLVGAVAAKRLHFEPTTFIFSFLAAPTAAFIQKQQADAVYFSFLSQRNPATLLQQYPLLNQSFKQVNQQVDTQISAISQRIKLLQENANRK